MFFIPFKHFLWSPIVEHLNKFLFRERLLLLRIMEIELIFLLVQFSRIRLFLAIFVYWITKPYFLFQFLMIWSILYETYGIWHHCRAKNALDHFINLRIIIYVYFMFQLGEMPSGAQRLWQSLILCNWHTFPDVLTMNLH